MTERFYRALLTQANLTPGSLEEAMCVMERLCKAPIREYTLYVDFKDLRTAQDMLRGYYNRRVLAAVLTPVRVEPMPEDVWKEDAWMLSTEEGTVFSSGIMG